MSSVKIRVGKTEFEFDSAPRGRQGEVHFRVAGSSVPHSCVYKTDAGGLWLELDAGVFGFDLETEVSDEGRTLYRITERGATRQWEGVAALHPGEENLGGAAFGAKRMVKIKAQMPGKVVRVQVAEGSLVQRDQPLLVMEAMKMENEIRAPQSGKIAKLRAQAGLAVETGAELLVIEPQD